MSHWLFLSQQLLLPLLLLLLLVECRPSCAHTITTNNAQSSTDIIDEFFKPGEISDVLKPQDGEKQSKGEEFTVKNIKSPFLVAVGDLMVALADVNYTEKKEKSNEFKMDVLAKYIETKENKWGDDAVKSNNDKWKTQMVTENKKKQENGKVVVKSSAVTVKDNKIYYIAVSNDTFKDNGAPSEPSADEKWYAQLVVGEANNNNGEGKTIEWSTKESSELVQRDELGKLNTKPSNIPPSDGVAFAIEDEKFLFIMKGKAKAENSVEKNLTAIFQLEGNGENENKLELLHVESHENCYPSFFKWEGKIIMAPTFCPPDVKKQMKVFDVTKNEFIDIDGPIARLQVFLEDKMHFVTAIIGGKKVLLLTQIRDPIWKSDVHLWITDGTRARDVGSIINENEGTFYGSVIYTNDELFALHQKYKNGETDDGQKDEDKFSLTRLKGLLGNITSTLQAWNKSDKIIPTLCSTIGGQRTPCANQLPTDGLVGFLHNTSEGNEKWKDEYFYTNATVKGGKKIDNNGFKFDGKGAGAKWPVGKKKEDQPYNFTDAGFTLVANVTIDDVGKNEKQNSVLGVVFTDDKDEKTKRIELWCTSESEWELTGNGDNSKNILGEKDKCQRESTYFVALILNNSKLFVHIDGEVLGETGSEKIKIETKLTNITHFYFGAENDNDESHVTVTNVLLYNRPFTKEKVGKLKMPKERKPAKQSNDSHNDEKEDDINNTYGGNEGKEGNGDEDVSPSRSSRIGEVEEKSTSQAEKSTVRGCYVGVFVFFIMLAHALCFL